MLSTGKPERFVGGEMICYHNWGRTSLPRPQMTTDFETPLHLCNFEFKDKSRTSRPACILVPSQSHITLRCGTHKFRVRLNLVVKRSAVGDGQQQHAAVRSSWLIFNVEQTSAGTAHPWRQERHGGFPIGLSKSGQSAAKRPRDCCRRQLRRRRPHSSVP